MLSGKQKSFLRSIGNELEPILIVGKNGITDTVLGQAREALEARELIKGRVLPNCVSECEEIAAELSAQLKAEVVQVIGRNFILYKHRDGDKRKAHIILPE